MADPTRSQQPVTSGQPASPGEGRMLRVLLVDDHPMYRAGLRAVIERMPDACPVGEAADGDGALRLVAELAPDVVLMDLHMPGVGGVEATRAISQQYPRTAVVVLTMLHDDGSMLAAMRAGARGYLIKGADEAEIIAALRMVAAGGAVFGPDVAARALDSVRAGTQTAGRPFPDLSERETDVLDLLARGLSNVAIAAELHLSHQTVRNYVSSIFTKLGAVDRADAIVRARDAGLGRDKSR